MATNAKVPVRRVLQPAAQVDVDKPVEWSDTHDGVVALSVAAAKAVLPNAADCSDQEVSYFLHYCAARHMNPFLQDAHLVKYDKSKPASIVTGYHFFMQAASRNSAYKGFKLWFVDEKGERITDGAETKDNVQAAICEVHIEGRLETKAVCRMVEFNRRQAQWNMMPVQMLGKCALGNAHRLADPGLGGMYLSEEMAQEYVDAEATELTGDESAAEEDTATSMGEDGAEAESRVPPLDRTACLEHIQEVQERVFGKGEAGNQKARAFLREHFGTEKFSELTDEQATECTIAVDEMLANMEDAMRWEPGQPDRQRTLGEA